MIDNDFDARRVNSIVGTEFSVNVAASTAHDSCTHAASIGSLSAENDGLQEDIKVLDDVMIGCTHSRPDTDILANGMQSTSY